jgi:hypothetical protein
MIVAMTGTQQGITYQQHWSFCKFLALYPDIDEVEAFLNGDCIGADLAVTNLVATFWPHVQIWKYPGDIPSKRAGGFSHVTMDPSDCLSRNREMVERSGLLVAFPGEFHEVLRSGTWATIRHARRRGIPTVFFWPDGKITTEPQ